MLLQRSVRDPTLSTMYIKPLSAIIDLHSIIHHSFIDDLQLQMFAPPDGISELLRSMQPCIGDVNVWATANMLRLNDNKTELMLVTYKRTKHLHNLPTAITAHNHNAVCLYDAFFYFLCYWFLKMVFVFMLYLVLLTLFVYFKHNFPSCAVLLICWIFLILCPRHFMWKGYVLSGEMALENDHYYYYYYY